MDIRLLVKKIKGRLDVEENEIFKDWYSSSVKNRIYFEHFRKNYNKQPQLNVNTQEAWNVVNSSLSTHNRAYLNFIIAAILVISAISVPVYLFMLEPSGLDMEVVDTDPDQIEEVLFVDNNGNSLVVSKEDTIRKGYYKINAEQLVIDPNKTQNVIGVNTIIVPRGKQFSVELSDGTKVYLNALSKLKFPSNFDSEIVREVELVYGEAFFEVTSAEDNGGKKFVVKNLLQDIEVVGTSFNVENYSKSEVVTTLVEGSINLEIGMEKFFMTPGQQAIVDSNSLQNLEQVNVQDHIAWKNGMFIFKEQSLKKIFTVLSRWYDIDVTFEHHSLEDIKFDGRFNNQLELSKILEIINNTKRVRFELNGNNITVMKY